MTITIKTVVAAPLDVVWRAWTTPDNIMAWNAASEDWHTTAARLDLRVGGTFSYRMAARDGSMGFDFEGVFTQVAAPHLLAFDLGGRAVSVSFTETAHGIVVEEAFEPDPDQPEDLQRDGWQAILDSFARHVAGLTGA